MGLVRISRLMLLQEHIGTHLLLSQFVAAMYCRLICGVDIFLRQGLM